MITGVHLAVHPQFSNLNNKQDNHAYDYRHNRGENV